ncbi:histidine kinase dimerization/phosphoacceptor domain-containing protein [Streptomyces sp. VB1]|nr:histidine kinase dimerization/phosphoacceptor domain-containing protein [Streptomyces sp. VB1]UZI31171.1 histidine kinase dimerization/phosphoacceptor domain-containing protein [Streptomyces sp. VB1]
MSADVPAGVRQSAPQRQLPEQRPQQQRLEQQPQHQAPPPPQQRQQQRPTPQRPPRASGSGARNLRRLRSAGLPVGVAALDGLVVNAAQASPVLWGALAAAGALVLRRRQPELALAAGLPGFYLGHLAFAPLIALYFLATHRRSPIPGAVGAVLVALAQFLPVPIGDITLLRLDHDTVLGTLDSCALGVGAFVLGRSARQRRERLREITESREREHRLLARHTLATERARLAREMHDVVAHKVSLISLQAGVIQVAEPDAPAVRKAAGVIRDLSVETLTELQHLVGVLRADGGNTRDPAPQPRIADLGTLVEESALPVELCLGTWRARFPKPWNVPRTGRCRKRSPTYANTPPAPGARCGWGSSPGDCAWRCATPPPTGQPPRRGCPPAATAS